MSADWKQGANLAGQILASGQVSGTNGEVTIYTVPASSSVKVATMSLCNTSASIVTLSVSVVPPAGTADGTHRILASYLLGAFDTISAEDALAAVRGALLQAAAFVTVNLDTANAVDYLITGSVSS